MVLVSAPILIVVFKYPIRHWGNCRPCVFDLFFAYFAPHFHIIWGYWKYCWIRPYVDWLTPGLQSQSLPFYLGRFGEPESIISFGLCTCCFEMATFTTFPTCHLWVISRWLFISACWKASIWIATATVSSKHFVWAWYTSNQSQTRHQENDLCMTLQTNHHWPMSRPEGSDVW